MISKICLLFPLLLQQFYSGGDGVSIGIGVGGGGISVSGGGETGTPASTPNNTTQLPSPQAGSSNDNLKDAYKALQAWKSTITVDPLGILNTWVGTNVCSYRGIFCSGSDTTASDDSSSSSSEVVVVGVDLNHAYLKGSLVPELSLLSDLTILHLNSNSFSGSVPDSFKGFKNLQELDISNNHFSGPFPFVALLLPKLLYLDIRYNAFSGQVPEELFNRPGLDAIFLNNNMFQGQIPQNLGSSPASVINLANNNFSGVIPSSFGFMGPRIKEILFLNNHFTGCIPEGVGLLTNVHVLDVSHNELRGHLPDTLSCLSDVEVLNLAYNQLSGLLPDVCSLKNLINLTISYNFFSGFSSQDCADLGFKNVGFDFSGNCIPGKNMQRPPPECSGIPSDPSCMRIPAAGTNVICSAMVQIPAASAAIDLHSKNHVIDMSKSPNGHT